MGHIDFSTATFTYQKDETKILPTRAAFAISNEVKPLARYEKSYITECGGFLHVPHEYDASQRCMYNLTGSQQDNLREKYGITDNEFNRLMRDSGAKFTRLDYAVDSNCYTANAMQFYRAVRSGDAKTRISVIDRSTQDRKVDGKWDAANTVYLGSKTSDQRIVVYDKAKQLKLLNQAWTRVELRVKGEFAQAMSFDALSNDFGDVARAKMRKLVDWQETWYQELVQGRDVDLSELGRKSRDRFMKWLEDMVIPAVHKRAAESPVKAKRLREVLLIAVLNLEEQIAKHQID